ncbi:hypothetical protein [Paraburkholderia tropica]|uniref:hypothetical protein n=1 Tax=Paraburkholderia tropica TaxID=92647 RepID=UPI003D2BFBCC
MDGAVLLNALASDPELAKIPVVLVSALAAPPLRCPPRNYLRKPFAAARLIELIRQYS